MHTINICNICSYCGNKYFIFYCSHEQSEERSHEQSEERSHEQSEERLPNIEWCREPFMEELSEIELNDIKN